MNSAVHRQPSTKRGTLSPVLRTKMNGRPAPSAEHQTVRVWTIQRAECWRRFKCQGVLRADGRRVCRDFRPAYQWLMQQMARRVGGYAGSFPVWFWHSPKPDLRHGGHLAAGEHGVRIELELPRERVLLFDFQSWHCVLNRWHLSLSERESKEWDRRTKGLDQYRAPLPAPLEAELQATWERTFDLSRLRRAKLWGPINEIQGVTEYVRLEEVRGVDEFVAR